MACMMTWSPWPLTELYAPRQVLLCPFSVQLTSIRRRTHIQDPGS